MESPTYFYKIQQKKRFGRTRTSYEHKVKRRNQLTLLAQAQRELSGIALSGIEPSGSPSSADIAFYRKLADTHPSDTHRDCTRKHSSTALHTPIYYTSRNTPTTRTPQLQPYLTL